MDIKEPGGLQAFNEEIEGDELLGLPNFSAWVGFILSFYFFLFIRPSFDHDANLFFLSSSLSRGLASLELG